MQRNVATAGPVTHGGAPAALAKPLQVLKRTVLACLLWEDNFYESGESIADRIQKLVELCRPEDVLALAKEARDKYRLRHVPLLLLREIARKPRGCKYADTLTYIIQRADEITEFLSLYWLDGKKPIPKQVKAGLANAFLKFNAYQLAKYNRDKPIKLRDVMFLCHPKPKTPDQTALFKSLADKTLAPPDTWEVALSGGADKKETFERLMREGNLGYMALLRNLRNMEQSGVDLDLVKEKLLAGAETSKALPFRYVAAARACMQLEPTIDIAMQRAMGGMAKLPGKTVVLVDVSGSMNSALSSKSDLTKIDAACALAVLVRGVSDDCRIFSFSNNLVEVPPRFGMALIDAIKRSQSHAGTALAGAVEIVREKIPTTDRLIVITDEQATDGQVRGPVGKGYMLNVASYQNGVAFGNWVSITGFSEACVDFIREYEAE